MHEKKPKTVVKISEEGEDIWYCFFFFSVVIWNFDLVIIAYTQYDCFQK